MTVATTIVVPLDGSAFAERALRPACAMAARLDGSRVLLISCRPDDIDVAERRLHDRVALYSDVVDVEPRVISDGEPADAILATVAAEPGAVLCMATHGRGGLRTIVLGSVAAEVVRRSPQPLILVGPRCRTALLPGERGRLLVCSDGSASSDSIVPVAATWSRRLELEPCLAEVVAPDEDPEPAHRPHPNREVEAASARLGELATRLSTPTPASTKVLHGDPGSSIAWFAEELPAALIAMATKSRRGFTRITMGSVADEVVRQAPCPILITRPAD